MFPLLSPNFSQSTMYRNSEKASVKPVQQFITYRDIVMNST